MYLRLTLKNIEPGRGNTPLLKRGSKGLVIDDAVVVVENIHRRGHEGPTAIADAVSQLMTPLLSSTLTTVVVFAPLSLLSGVPGQFFRALSLSLTVAVLLSLFLSVTVVPLLARWAFSRSAIPEEREGSLDRVYGRALDTMLRHRVASVAIAIVLAGASVLLFRTIGTGFLPPADEGGFVIDYLTPAGSALEQEAVARGLPLALAQRDHLGAERVRFGGSRRAVGGGVVDDDHLRIPVSDRKSTRLNSSHVSESRMPSSA